MPEGLIDPATGEFYEWFLSDEKRLKGGLREIQPTIGGGYLDGGGRDLRPTAPVGGGGRGRDLRPSGLQAVPAPGANNMFSGLDPVVAFSGVSTLLHNRFDLRDADRAWSRNMPNSHRVYGMDLGSQNGSRSQDYDRNRLVGSAKLACTEKKKADAAAAKAPKVTRGPNGGIRVAQRDPLMQLSEGISDLSESTGFGPAMRGIVNYMTPFGKSHFHDERPDVEDKYMYPLSYVPETGFGKTFDSWGRRWVGTAAASTSTGFTGRSLYQTVDRMSREVGLSLADQTPVATAMERDEYRIVVSKTFLRFAFAG
jgi:hypothetical protein